MAETDHVALLTCMMAPGERPGLTVVDGEGARVTLADGRSLIDAGSISAAVLGHRHPALVRAVTTAAHWPYVSDGHGHPAKEQAAADLLHYGFEDDDGWVVRLCSSASEANDLALSLAQVITGRTPIVSRQLAYHGGMGLARDATQHPLWHGGLSSPTGQWQEAVVPQDLVRMLPYPQSPATADGAPALDEPTLQTAPALLDGAAALILDFGSNGTCFHSGAYQDALAQAAADAGALWISDEAVTGLGRLGRGFAFQHGSSRPDIVTLGKGITAGASPGGAVVISQRLAEIIGDRRWMTYSTFRGHPVTAAAISATVRTIAEEDLPRRAASIGEPFGAHLRAIAIEHESVVAVRGQGLLWAIELRGAPEHQSRVWHGEGTAPSIADVASAAILDHGAIVSAYSGTVLWIVPPLVITSGELERVAHAIEAGLVAADQQCAAATARS